MPDNLDERSKLKKLLEEGGSRLSSVRKKASSTLAARRELQSPEHLAERAASQEAKHKEVRQSEKALKAAREKELTALKKRKAAKIQRKEVDKELFQEKYGQQIEQAKAAGRGALEVLRAAGRGVGEVGKYAIGTETLTETEEEIRRSVDVGKRRGFVTEPLRQLAARRRIESTEDLEAQLAEEGVTLQEYRKAKRSGDMFDFNFDFDLRI